MTHNTALHFSHKRDVLTCWAAAGVADCPCSSVQKQRTRVGEEIRVTTRAMEPSTKAAAKWSGTHNAQGVFLCLGGRRLINNGSLDKIREWTQIANNDGTKAIKRTWVNLTIGFQRFYNRPQVEVSLWEVFTYGKYLFQQCVPILVSCSEGQSDTFPGFDFKMGQARTRTLLCPPLCAWLVLWDLTVGPWDTDIFNWIVKHDRSSFFRL